MYVRRIQLTNYGPIERLDIACPFDNEGRPRPLVFVGENGSGKSVTLSHIVNGLLSAQQTVYPSTPEVAEGRVYKLRSGAYIKQPAQFYFSRVEFDGEMSVCELQLAQHREAYESIPSEIQETAQELWDLVGPHKSSAFRHHFGEHRARVERVFERNCILYFPADRWEDPAWLNLDNLTAKARLTGNKALEGATNRTIITRSPLHANQNWLFDIAYDFRALEQIVQNMPFGGGLNSPAVTLPIVVGYNGNAGPLYNLAIQILASDGEACSFAANNRPQGTGV